MKKMHILLLGALPILLLFVTCAQDTPSSVSPSAVQTDITLAKNSNIDAFDMNDRFSGSGASGSGTVKVINGQMTLTIHGRNLTANHAYEVHAVVNVPTGTCAPFPAFNPLTPHIFPVTSDKNGKLTFKIVGFNLGLTPGSGPYRLDYVVVDDPGHAHPPAPFPTNLLLACAPASCVTI